MELPKDALSRICGGIIHNCSVYSGLSKRLEMFVCGGWGQGLGVDLLTPNNSALRFQDSIKEQ